MVLESLFAGSTPVLVEPISSSDFRSLCVFGCLTVYDPIASISQVVEVIE